MHCRRIKLKSGYSWECFADAPRNPVTGKRRQIKRRGRTRAEARSRVEEAIKNLQEKRYDESIARTITFEKIVDDWMRVYVNSGVKPGSIRVRTTESNLLKRYFGQATMGSITHKVYQDMLIDLKDKEYADNTIRGVHTCAGMIFKYAIRNKFIKDSPCEGAVVPRRRKTIEEIENDEIEQLYFDSNELEEFLRVVNDKGSRLDVEWFYLLAFTGMRSGEMCALKKDDLNFDKNTIKIVKTIYSPTNNTRNYALGTTKNDTVRTIEVDQKIMSLLKKRVIQNDKHKLKNRTIIDKFYDTNFVFQEKDGRPFLPRNIADSMRRLMEHTTITKNLTPHSLRHTHVSMLTEAGDDLPSIMYRVGHLDPNTTLRIYTHVTEKMKGKSAKKITKHHSDLLEKISF